MHRRFWNVDTSLSELVFYLVSSASNRESDNQGGRVQFRCDFDGAHHRKKGS